MFCHLIDLRPFCLLLQDTHHRWALQSTCLVLCLPVGLHPVPFCPPPALVLPRWRAWMAKPCRSKTAQEAKAPPLSPAAVPQAPLPPQHPSTRASCTSCVLRSWPIRCWHVGSLYQIICRWQCRVSGPCQACHRDHPCPVCHQVEEEVPVSTEDMVSRDFTQLNYHTSI